jgi:resuscitation-promoting factor RpfB
MTDKVENDRRATATRGVLGIAVLAVAVSLQMGCGPPAGTPATEPVRTEAALVVAPTAEPTPTPSPSPSPTPAVVAPVVEKRTVVAKVKLPFTTKRVRDSSLTEGRTKVRTRGATGVKTVTYEVTLTDGVQTGRRLVSSVVTTAPTAKVVAIGTRPVSRCDPNYSGCVPIASDVDCAGGSGNGPAYVSGVVRVIGSDIYDLDRDNDGLGCDT